MLLIDLLLLIFCATVLYYLYNGAMYVPTTRAAVDAMLKLVSAKPGIRVADLGSGDGRIIIGFAQSQAQAVGFEVNPFLVAWSRWKISHAGLSSQAKVRMKSFWGMDLSQFDVVVVFGMTHIMGRLEEKFARELRPGTLIVSNVFQVKNFRQIASKDTVFLYQV